MSQECCQTNIFLETFCAHAIPFRLPHLASIARPCVAATLAQRSQWTCSQELQQEARLAQASGIKMQNRLWPPLYPVPLNCSKRRSSAAASICPGTAKIHNHTRQNRSPMSCSPLSIARMICVQCYFYCCHARVHPPSQLSGALIILTLPGRNRNRGTIAVLQFLAPNRNSEAVGD